MALAGDHAQVESQSWRNVASFVYLYGLAAAAFAILFFFPLHLDLHLGTVIPVLLVAVFLVAMERPTVTAVTTVAPLTAIIAASAVVFGDWVVILAVTAVLAVRVRIADNVAKTRELLSPSTFGQVGCAIISSYGVLETLRLVNELLRIAPHFLGAFVMLLGIVAAGLAWQTINNLFVKLHYGLRGKQFVLTQLIRTGVVASIYAYLLVATYKFGGLMATAIFYVVVAQIKVVQDVLGITSQLHKLERAQAQAQGLVLDLIRFTDAEHVEFSREVQNIAQMLARHVGMSKRDTEYLSLAAQLHEMGKSHLPARIRYNSDVNAKEIAQRKTYSRWGGLMVRAADALLPNQIADWIEFHGEHFDGSGYPRGLKGEDIPLASRIITVARDYVRFLTGYDGAEAVDKEKALSLLREGSGTLYDPRLVKLLYELVS